MCGIAGIVRREGLAPEDRSAVGRMTAAQAHRGPAADGVHCSEQVALGHRRLSIIDVSAVANQPMSNEDGSVWVTYNGEIYNHLELRSELLTRGHQFRSLTDTEVLVHGYEEWGIEGLLERLRGMFAFALHDTAKRGVFLARDRFGIKPLYVWTGPNNDALIFASEVKALLASGQIDRTTDLSALAGFLLTGSIPAPATVIRGVTSLLPGHYLSWQDGNTRMHKYWDLADRVNEGSPEPAAGSVERIRVQLEKAVTSHLMSDVPLGVFLSGGVDSGAIVALAARALGQSSRLKTLTVVFDEQEFSEEHQARAISERFGTDHQEIRVTRDEFLAELPDVLAAMDQPTNDGVNTYIVSKAARQAGLTVVLSGLGGDEVFWGYRHYRWLQQGPARWLAGSPAPVQRAIATAASLYGTLRGQEKWMRMSFMDGAASSRDMYLLLRGFFPPQQVAQLLGLTQREVDAAVEQHFDRRETGKDATSQSAFNRFEFRRYLHDQLLRDADVFSMAHSLETRVPLLDHLLVEEVARTQAALRMSNGVNKPLLVHAVGDPLLDAAGRAPKMGFSFPMDRWMRSGAGPLEEMALSTGLLNRKAVGTFWTAFRGGQLHWSRAWALSVVGANVH